MKSKTILGADGATKMQQITVGIHGKGGEAGIKAIQQLVGITDMANYGFHMDDVYQGENLTPVIREFEGIIKDGDFKIADNNLLKTHFLNVALKHNMETRKFRPIKIEQRAHIDGFVSVIDAMTVRQKYWEECGELLKNAA